MTGEGCQNWLRSKMYPLGVRNSLQWLDVFFQTLKSILLTRGISQKYLDGEKEVLFLIRLVEQIQLSERGIFPEFSEFL